jgi:hypothetical protein
LNVVSNSTQLQRLVSKGIIGVPIPSAPPLRGGAKFANVFAPQLKPLLSVPAPSANFTIREHVLDRVSNAAQAFSPLVVFGSEITDLRSRNRIARS